MQLPFNASWQELSESICQAPRSFLCVSEVGIFAEDLFRTVGGNVVRAEYVLKGSNRLQALTDHTCLFIALL